MDVAALPLPLNHLFWKRLFRRLYLVLYSLALNSALAVLIVASGLPEGRPEISRWYLHWNLPYKECCPAGAQGSPFLWIRDLELEILLIQKEVPGAIPPEGGE